MKLTYKIYVGQFHTSLHHYLSMLQPIEKVKTSIHKNNKQKIYHTYQVTIGEYWTATIQI